MESSGSEETSPSSDGGISRVASAARDARARRGRRSRRSPGTRRCPTAPEAESQRSARRPRASATRSASGATWLRARRERVRTRGRFRRAEDRVASNERPRSRPRSRRARKERGAVGSAHDLPSGARKVESLLDSETPGLRACRPACGESVDAASVWASRRVTCPRRIVAYGGGDERVPLGVFARLLGGRRVAPRPGPEPESPRHLPGPMPLAVQGDQRLVPVLVLAKRGESARRRRTRRPDRASGRWRGAPPRLHARRPERGRRASVRSPPSRRARRRRAARASPRRATPSAASVERRDDARSRGASAASERIRDTLPASEARKGRVKPGAERVIACEDSVARASSAMPSWSPMSTSFSQMRLTRIRRSRHSSNPARSSRPRAPASSPREAPTRRADPSRRGAAVPLPAAAGTERARPGRGPLVERALALGIDPRRVLRVDLQRRLKICDDDDDGAWRNGVSRRSRFRRFWDGGALQRRRGNAFQKRFPKTKTCFASRVCFEKHGTPRRRARVSGAAVDAPRSMRDRRASRSPSPAACPGPVGASAPRTETRWLVASPSGTGSPPRASSASARETRRGSRGRRAAAGPRRARGARERPRW